MPTRRVSRVAWGVGIAAASVLVAGALASAVVAAGFARTVVTPPRRRPEDERILGATASTITLGATIDALTPGRYGLWFSGDTGFARIGDVLEHDEESVTRELIEVVEGDLSAARRGRFSGWYYLSPADLGVPFDDVIVPTALGGAPAWLVPAATPSDRWVIQVHGRAVRREEGLRAIPVYREAGYSSLLISYRNDGDAPASPDGRYRLGDTEWLDVEAAIRFALESGARHIVLQGWSMGGATVLQTITRSPWASHVAGVVLESPVVDWVTALQFQGVENRLPGYLRASVLALLSASWARFVTGLEQPVDLRRLDLVARASELTTPILLLHSVDDGFIPADASVALAAARPDLVTFERFTTARHTRLWNYDEARWTGAIRNWLERLSDR